MTSVGTDAGAADRGDDRWQLDRLARRGTASVVGAGFSAGFGILLVVVVTHGFSPTVAGTLFVATSVFLILESFALLGTDTGLVRVLPAQLASGREADVRRTLVVSSVPVVGLALALAVGLYVITPAIAGHLVGDEAAAIMVTMLRTLAVMLPVAALHDQVMAATRGVGFMRPTVLVDNVGRLGLQAGAVLCVYLAGGGPLLLAAAWSLPYGLGTVAGAVWLARLVSARIEPSTAPASPWRQLTHEFWSFTAPRAIARVIQTALKRSDIVLVAALASPAEAALYTAATRFVVLGQLFVQSVQQALSPQVAALFARDNSRGANTVYQAATLWSVIVAWPLYLVLAGFAAPLMGVFGDGYAVATDVVLILSLTMLLATACGPVDSILLMAGRSWLSLRNSAVALAINVALNVVLIPIDGIRGAAVAWAVAIAVRNALPLMIVRRELGMWPLTTTTGFVALGAVTCFGGVGVLAAITDLPGTVDLILLAVAAVVYGGGTWSARKALGLDAFAAALRSGRRRRRAGLTDSDELAPPPPSEGRPANRLRVAAPAPDPVDMT